MKKLLTKIILLLYLSTVYSQKQKAELFFIDGTSISGYADIKNNKIEFRLSLDDKPDKWDELMVESLIIEEFGFDVTYSYIKLKLDDPKKLLQIQAEGEVELYADIKRVYRGNLFGSSVNPAFNGSKKIYGENNNYSEKIKYYVKKKKEKYPTQLFGNGSFRKKAKIYFNDCIGIQEKLKSKEFDIHNVNQMVDYYNNFCTE